MLRPNVLLQAALALMVSAACATGAHAQLPALPDPPTPVEVEVDGGALLKAGEYRWLSAPSRNGMPVVVMVDLQKQRAHVYRGGALLAITTVSTGKAGHGTPAGVYPILQKKKAHRSNRYEDERGRPASMPFMQRLTWDGVALHAGRVRERPASHGCVRLPREFAEQLYAITRHGDLVVVSEDASLESLARAGLEMQLALMLGASSPIREIAGAVAIEPPAETEHARGVGTAAASTGAF